MKNGNLFYLDITLILVIISSLCFMGNYMWFKDWSALETLSQLMAILHFIPMLLVGLSFVRGYHRSILLPKEGSPMLFKPVSEIMDSPEISDLVKAKYLRIQANNLRKMLAEDMKIFPEVPFDKFAAMLKVDNATLLNWLQKIFSDIPTAKEFYYIWGNPERTFLISLQTMSGIDKLKLIIWCIFLVISAVIFIGIAI